MTFAPDPPISDAEWTNAIARLEDRFSYADLVPDHPVRPTHVDPLGYGRWGAGAYFAARQRGEDHETATQGMLAQIEAVLHPLPFPKPIRQPRLPMWDVSDPDGAVHTTPPPELVIPSGFDPLFMRADFAGVTLNKDRWSHLGTLPFLVGANSTPLEMLMSPMLILYPYRWQDAYLTEYCERGYSHFVLAADGWNFTENHKSFTPAEIVKWAQYLKAQWGRYVVYWGRLVKDDPYLRALVDAHAIDFHLVGEEVDSKTTAEGLEAILDNNLAMHQATIPTAVHFTSNYPEGFPRDTFLTHWGKYDGTVHLCWQADQNNSAGKQAAMLYYARMRVNLGWKGGNDFSGTPAPNSRVYAYETMASKQLIGQCSEASGCLRSLELLYATRRPEHPSIRPVSGFGNGCRVPTGDPI